MGFDIGGFLKGIAPTLASFLPGPLGPIASKIVGDVLGVDPTDSAAVGEALTHATPDQILALKKADQDFQVRMTELGFANAKDMEKIAADDRSSARAREITTGDNTPKVLAGLVTIGFFGLLTFILKWGVPAEGHDIIIAMVGILGTAWVSIMNYYFGSSSGSAAKSVTLDKLTTTTVNGNGSK